MKEPKPFAAMPIEIDLCSVDRHTGPDNSLAPASTLEVTVLARRIRDDESLTGREGWSDADRADVDRVIEGPPRERIAARRTLTRQALGLVAGPDAASTEILRTCEHCGHPGHGRPRPAAGGVHISASTSGRWVVVAVAADPVGVDVESVDAMGDPDLVAASVLTAPELDRYLTVDERGRAEWLTGRWTRKEAVLKASGRGVPDLPEPDVSGDTVGHRGATWIVWTWRLAPGVMLSVATGLGSRVRWVAAI
ncbi:MAG: 4'-phosphopantetheinyl transferase superfamily protein [Micrococcales bacterium]|nr:4'-phosphopantetheinyl transferase superfamily protein [Micrococcales bacterium]